MRPRRRSAASLGSAAGPPSRAPRRCAFQAKGQRTATHLRADGAAPTTAAGIVERWALPKGSFGLAVGPPCLRALVAEAPAPLELGILFLLASPPNTSPGGGRSPSRRMRGSSSPTWRGSRQGRSWTSTSRAARATTGETIPSLHAGRGARQLSTPEATEWLRRFPSKVVAEQSARIRAMPRSCHAVRRRTARCSSTTRTRSRPLSERSTRFSCRSATARSNRTRRCAGGLSLAARAEPLLRNTRADELANGLVRKPHADAAGPSGSATGPSSPEALSPEARPEGEVARETHVGVRLRELQRERRGLERM